MKKYFFTSFLLIIVSIGYGQVLDCPLKVKIKNSSKYQIDKLILFNKQVDSISSKSESDFFCMDWMYPSIKFDITFTKKKRWGHIVVQPVDHIGETILKNGVYKISIRIKKRKGNKYDVSCELNEIR